MKTAAIQKTILMPPGHENTKAHKEAARSNYSFCVSLRLYDFVASSTPSSLEKTHYL